MSDSSALALPAPIFALARKETAIDYQDIIEAYKHLKEVVFCTELRKLDWLERLQGYQVYAKLEHTQRTGSFKFRGAFNRLRNHPVGVPVIAASAGNHGFAIAAAGQLLGIETNIVFQPQPAR